MYDKVSVSVTKIKTYTHISTVTKYDDDDEKRKKNIHFNPSIVVKEHE